MTQAKAQTVSTAAIAQGFRVDVFLRIDGEWVVRAAVQNGTNAITAAQLNTFCVNNAVTGNVTSADLV